MALFWLQQEIYQIWFSNDVILLIVYEERTEFFKSCVRKSKNMKPFNSTIDTAYKVKIMVITDIILVYFAGIN